MTSAADHRGSSPAVNLVPMAQRPDAHSTALCHQIKSFDWKARGARPHPLAHLEADKLEQATLAYAPCSFQASTLTTDSAHGGSRGSFDPR